MIVQIPCSKDCGHGTPEGWQQLVLRAHELAEGKEIAYAGIYGPDKGEDAYPVHAWKVLLPRRAESQHWTPPLPEPDEVDLYSMEEALMQVRARRSRGEPAFQPAPPPPPAPKVVEGEATFPSPVVSSRDNVLPDHRPKALVEMIEYLDRNGWYVALLQYAEGFVPHVSTGRPLPKPRPSWGIRAERKGALAVAVYRGQSEGWKWDTLHVVAGRFVRYETVTQFKEALR